VARYEVDLDALRRLSPAKRREAEARLVRFKDALTANPLWKYHPHERQLPFHEATGTKIRAFVAGNRAGKSHAGVIDDVIQVVDRECVPPWLDAYKLYEPPCYIRIVTPDLTTTGEGVVVDKLMALVPKTQLRGGKWDRAFDQRRMQLHLANGSYIEFLSTAQELNKHGGSARHRVHFDEEPYGNKGQRIFTEALYRITDYGGDITFTMTPVMGLSWSYDLLTKDGGEPRWDDEVKVVVASTFDNPHLDHETLLWVLENTPENEREARIHGRFIALQGLIYPEFDRHSHIIPEHNPPEDARVLVGIDPGYRYQAAAIYAYLGDFGQVVAFEEIVIPKGTVRDMAEAIHATNARYGVKPFIYVIDPAARNKTHQTGRDDQWEYQKHGIPTLPGFNSRTLGFGQIKDRLADQTLVVTANCEVLIEQFAKYRWRREPGGDSAGRDEPVKRDDHALDALRYLVMSDVITPNKKTKETPQDQRTRLFSEHLRRIGRRRHRESHHLGGIYY
jgi:hypothetical protein